MSGLIAFKTIIPIEGERLLLITEEGKMYIGRLDYVTEPYTRVSREKLLLKPITVEMES